MKFILKLIVLVVIVAAGWLAYRVYWKGEDPKSILADFKNSAEARFQKGDYEEAAGLYEQLLEKLDGEAGGKSDDIRRARVRISRCRYEIAQASGWKKDEVKQAIKANQKCLEEFPDLDQGEKDAIRKRIEKLKSF